VAAVVSLKGIDEALGNLSYKNPQALKSRLVHTIRGLYEDGNVPESLEKIDAERLVKALWDTGDDPAAIKAKRKNLSSTKSSVNSDLRKLFKEGKNPEGVIIGRDNLFVMSDEAKDKLISTFDAGPGEDPAGSLKQIAQSLNAIQEILSKPDVLDDQHSSEASATLEDLRNTVHQLSEKIAVGKKGGDEEGSLLGGKSEDDLQDTVPGDVAASPVDVEGGDVEELEPLEDEAVVDDLDVVDEILEPDELDDDVETVDDDLGKVLETVDEQPLDQEPGDAEGVESIDDGEAEEGLRGGESEGDLQDTVPGDWAEPPVDVENVDVEEPEPLKDEAVVDDLDVVDEVLEPDELDGDIETVDDDDLEEVLETVDDPDSDLQDTDLDEEAQFVDSGENVEPLESAEEIGLPVGSLGEEPNHDLDEESEKARRLAEVFDGYLGAMERFYNQFLLIPEGPYTVGSAVPKRDERPEEIVHLPAFYVGKFPVTNTLFEIFVEKTGYVTTAEKVGYGTVYYGRLCKEMDDKNSVVRFRCNGTVHSKTVEGAFWYQPCGPGSTLHKKRDHPVVQVSLEDAMAFASWTGKRLPKEDEWEAAARSAKGYVYPWGNEWKGDACNIEDNEAADTTPVDTFKELTSQLAIVDTLGNVLEWTSDVFPSIEHPRDSSRHYITKGGSWVSGKEIHLFNRFKVKADAPSNILGFRCVAY
jgi:formylglycine-generating enzyme required for sulfatase activity